MHLNSVIISFGSDTSDSDDRDEVLSVMFTVGGEGGFSNDFSINCQMSRISGEDVLQQSILIIYNL